jgi:NagD protein
METDILGGVQLGFKTILVLSGGTGIGDLSKYAYRPDKVVESIADLHHAQLVREFSRVEPSRRRTPAAPPAHLDGLAEARH